MALENAGTKTNSKINIISQLFIKSANMSSRKDFLNNSLQVSGERHQFKEKSQSPTKLIKKEKINGSNKEGKVVDEIKEEASYSSDSSSTTSERTPKKVVKKKNYEKVQMKTKIKSTKKEISSSDSEEENLGYNKRRISKDNSDSDNNNKEMINKKMKLNINEMSPMENKIMHNSDSEEKNLNKRKTSDTINNNKSDNYDEEMISEKSKLQESNKLLQEFVMTNEYEILENKEKILLNSLNKDEEVYLLQTPKNLDPQFLLNMQVPFDKSTNIKYNGEIFNWTTNNENTSILNLIDFDKLLNVETMGTITIQQNRALYNGNIELQCIDDIPDYPDNLKKRHPTLGAKYKKKLHLSDNILKKFENPVEHISKKHKKKLKQIPNDAVELEDINNLDIFKLLDNHENQSLKMENKDKKKKRKKST